MDPKSQETHFPADTNRPWPILGPVFRKVGRVRERQLCTTGSIVRETNLNPADVPGELPGER